MPARVFISYSTLDLAIATQARDTLIAAGHQPYIADYDAHAGAHLTAELKAQIQAADVFVVFWSDYAKNSEWVQQEIGIAEGANKVVVPVLLTAGLKVPGFIADRKYVDAHADLETGLLRVREAVDLEGAKIEKAQGWFIVGAIAVILAVASSK